SRLARWLSLAGYRSAGAPTAFVLSTIGGVGVGAVAGVVYNTSLVDALVAMVAAVPGGVGDFMRVVLEAGPGLLLAAGALSPTLVVRARRRARVASIEQDLPLALELFATMGEAGLGFDAALAKVVRAQESHRPLVGELLAFQRDMLAGVSRAQALRHLAH